MSGRPKRRTPLAGLLGPLRCCAILIALLCATVAAAAEPLALDVAQARLNFDARTHEPIIVIVLMPASREALAHFTAANVGRKVDMRIDGKMMLQSVVREPILGGTVQISGPKIDELRALVDRLAAGKARLEVEVSAE